MNKILQISIIALVFFIVGCSSSQSNIPNSDAKSVSDKKINIENNNEIEILKTNFNALCKGEVSTATVDYVVKTKEFENTVNFILADSSGKELANIKSSSPSGDATAKLKFRPTESGNLNLKLTGMFRGNKVYEQTIKASVSPVKPKFSVELQPMYDFDTGALTQPTWYLANLYLKPESPCTEVPEAPAGIRINGKDGKVLREFRLENKILKFYILRKEIGDDSLDIYPTPNRLRFGVVDNSNSDSIVVLKDSGNYEAEAYIMGTQALGDKKFEDTTQKLELQIK